MDATIKYSFPLTGMSCASCAISVESMLKSQNGVKMAAVNYASSNVLVEYNPKITGPEEFKRVVQSIGYDLILGENSIRQQAAHTHNETVHLRKKTILAALLTIPVVVIGMFMMNLPYANQIMLVLSTPVVFWFGRTFFINAFKQLKHGQTNMDTLVALSTGIAWLFSFTNTLFPHLLSHQGDHAPVYFEAASVIIVFILLGKLLEERGEIEYLLSHQKTHGASTRYSDAVGQIRY